MHEEFLLNSAMSRELYHGQAENLPVIDFHNHLSVRDLAENRKFATLSELWIDSDPYKHRVMRITGVPETLITGKNTDPYDRFAAWAETVPKLIGNPIFHWVQLELKRVFGLNLPLSPATAKEIWDEAGMQLKEDRNSARGILTRFHVEEACPCCGIAENPEPFRKMNGPRITPSLRGDDLLNMDSAFLPKLGRIDSLEAFKTEIAGRLDALHELGCRFADHALDGGFRYLRGDGGNAARFARVASGCALGEADRTALNSEILRFLAGEYALRGWVLQLHIGAERFTSSRLRGLAGPAGGFAGIAHPCDMASICSMLDDFERGGGLPQTVLYPLNPADNAAFAVLTGSYSEDGIPGKIQFGPAWWYNDHLSGMRAHWEALSAFGVLSTFIGMTTDSRSLLSFVRHEYFRRAFCAYVAEKTEKGEFPDDPELLKTLVYNVCYGNLHTIMERNRK